MTVTGGDRLSPMPTPHSRRGRRRGPKVVVVTILLLLLPVLLFEAGVRALIATDRLPSAASHSEQLDIGLINVRALKPQDVLLMGDSQIATGLDPAVLRQLLEDELGRKAPVYNFGQPASSTYVNQLLLDLVAREGRMPRVVIMDISMSSLVESQKVREPGQARQPVFSDAAGRPTLLDSALGREMAGCGIETEIVDRLDCEVAHLSAAWRWHGRPERIIRAAISGPQFGQKESRGKLRKDGFFARQPAREGRLEQQIANGDYAQSRIFPAFNQGEADDYVAFKELVEANGGSVIFVQVPLTRPYTAELVSRNPDWEADRRAAADQLEAAIGQDIIYVESYGDWWTDQSASDLNHLSADAAAAFTQQLWDMPDFRAQLVTALGGEVADGSPVPEASAVPVGSPGADPSMPVEASRGPAPSVAPVASMTAPSASPAAS